MEEGQKSVLLLRASSEQPAANSELLSPSPEESVVAPGAVPAVGNTPAPVASITAEKKNPLLIEPVLEIIFKYLSEAELRPCRVVCRIWNLEVLRIKHHVELDTVEGVERLLNVMQSQRLYKVSHLRLNKMDLNEPEVFDLLKRVRPSLVSLSMNRCWAPHLRHIQYVIRTSHRLQELCFDDLLCDTGRHLLFPIYNHEGRKRNATVLMPKLRRLEFSSTGDTDRTTFFTAVLTSCPNLESLTLNNPTVDPKFDFSTFRHPPKLKRLHLRMNHSKLSEPRQFCIAIMDFMKKLQLKGLDELIFENWTPRLDTSQLREFINSQAKTLTKLTLTQRSTDSDSAPYYMPILPLSLPKVKQLTIQKCYVKNVNELASLECLEKFRLVSGSSNWGRILAPQGCGSQASLKDLCLDWIDVRSFRVLCLTFFNLHTLRLNQCDDDLLPCIFTHLRNLKRLTCLDNGARRMTTSAFTGISNEDMEHFSIRSNKAPKLDSSACRAKPYIGNMTNLEFLFLYFDRPPTEDIVSHGLLDLRNLERLIIIGLTLAEEALEKLKDTTGLKEYSIPNSFFVKEDLKKCTQNVGYPAYQFLK